MKEPDRRIDVGGNIQDGVVLGVYLGRVKGYPVSKRLVFIVR